MRFWLKCSPSIADQSLKVSRNPQHRKKIPITETEAAHIDPNRQKLTKIGYARNAKVAGTDVLEGLIFSLLDWK